MKRVRKITINHWHLTLLIMKKRVYLGNYKIMEHLTNDDALELRKWSTVPF